MTIDVRGSIYTLLSNIGVNVYHTRLDPIKADKYPLISVQLDNVNRNQIGDNFTYQVKCDVSVIVSVATTDEDFDTQLDTLVTNTLTKILTDPVWNTQFEYVSSINTKYGFIRAGETDLSSAFIVFTVQYTEVYNPNITAMWNTTSINIDCVSPFDPNLASSGPDGRIEAHLTI